MPPPSRPVAPLKQAAVDNEAAQKRAAVNKMNLQATFEAVFSTPQGMEAYDWLMNHLEMDVDNETNSADIYRSVARRKVAGDIRKISINLYIQWRKLKARKEVE